MSAAHLLAVALPAIVAAALAWAGPAVLRRLPEPPPPLDDEDAEGGAEPVEAAGADTETAAEPGAAHDEVDEVAASGPAVPDEKVPYAVLADRPRLAPWLAVVAAVTAGSAGLALGPDPSLPVWVLLAALGALLAYVDWTTRLLPFLLVAPAYPVVALLLVVASAVTGDWSALLRAAIAWLAVFGLFWITWFLYRRGIGYGDVRLSGVLGMALGWLGWEHAVLGLYSAFLLGAVVGGVLVALKVVDRRGFAFGPFMLAGTWVGVVVPAVLGRASG